jgi:glycosyltransferase involved in cell wall biosynthesis
MPSQMKLLCNVNAGWFFISHRLDIARAARDAGYEVHVSADIESPEEVSRLESEGFKFHRVKLKRGALDPISDLLYLRQLNSIMRAVRPDLVHNITVKPIVYGTLAARMSGVRGIVNGVTGLGYAFSGDRSRQVVSYLVRTAYKVALNRPHQMVIFENEDDIHAFSMAGILDRRQTVLVKGSGVDLRAFGCTEEPDGDPVVVLPARMLRDKGVLEFCEAADILRSRGFCAGFVLAGRLDFGNPSGIGESELARLEQETGVRWLGHVSNMPMLYRNSHIVCLPSYREGLPKTLQEACACGRPIVTTDVPGCRAAVRHGENGLLVEARNSMALANALATLLGDAELRRKMGAAGRRMAEAEFDVRAVARATLDVYRNVAA